MEIGRTKWRPIFTAAALAILLLPLIAMQFTSEVNWTAFDFVAAAMLLALIGSGLECAVRLTTRQVPRLLLIGGVVAGGLLLWAEGAVGIF